VVIALNDFHDNQDGTAWLIVDEPPTRHTFPIEVECGTCCDRSEWCGFNDDGPNNPDCSTGREFKRVSVVPGMVLPIITGHPYGPFSHVDGYLSLESSGRAQCWQIDGIQDSVVVELPPSAKPGRWAVQLRVAS